jgi:hypothetical protein
MPPLPFRRLSRRSGRIPAEPYPPLKCLYSNRTKPTILAERAVNSGGLGAEPPIQQSSLSELEWLCLTLPSPGSLAAGNVRRKIRRSLRHNSHQSLALSAGPIRRPTYAYTFFLCMRGTCL